MPSQTLCEFCGEPVNTKEPGNFIFVEGWEKIRRTGDGGGHGLTERHVLNKYACRECMRKREQGINTAQGDLF
jgi:hypothetical protein